jgi:hypothetical protein
LFSSSINPVDQPGEDDLRLLGTVFASGHVEQRAEHGGDGTLGVARATTVDATVLEGRHQLFAGGTHGVHVWREDDTVADLATRRQADEDVVAVGQDGAELHVEARVGGRADEEFRNLPFARDFAAGFDERRVHARQGDQLGEKLDKVGHAARVERLRGATGGRKESLSVSRRAADPSP